MTGCPYHFFSSTPGWKPEYVIPSTSWYIPRPCACECLQRSATKGHRDAWGERNENLGNLMKKTDVAASRGILRFFKYGLYGFGYLYVNLQRGDTFWDVPPPRKQWSVGGNWRFHSTKNFGSAICIPWNTPETNQNALANRPGFPKRNAHLTTWYL